jgi:demethylmenaquinone methyltransferase / 2-methoxy-6-polyprenyl-1,4-benzoquinol methylase
MQDDNYTDFGFKKVKLAEKAAIVAGVFDSVAPKYDLMNDLMSLGVHRAWKYYTAHLMRIKAKQNILDLACGSCDLAKLISKKLYGKDVNITLADINNAMLRQGRSKLLNLGLVKNINYIQADAETLPFLDNTFHCITMAFGLRNVTDKNKALHSMYRVCKPGGKIMILEFSKPQLSWVNNIYDWYSFKILPKIGRMVAHDEASYQYLAESIRMHPAQDELKTMIKHAGFADCSYHNLSLGIVALHIAYKY